MLFPLLATKFALDFVAVVCLVGNFCLLGNPSGRTWVYDVVCSIDISPQLGRYVFFSLMFVYKLIFDIKNFFLIVQSVGLGLSICGEHFEAVLTLRVSLISKLHSCFSLVRLPIVCQSVLTGYDSVSYYSVYQLRCPLGFIELVIAFVKLVWTYFSDLF